MRMFLSTSTWILVKSGWIAALIPFHIVIASTTKTNDAFKLNVNACINFHSQLWMLKLPIALCDNLDPLEFILINLPCSFLQSYQSVFLLLKVGKFGFGEWIVCVTLYLIYHFTLTFFALIKVIWIRCFITEKKIPFFVFHILHNSITTLSILTLGPIVLVA